MTTNKEKLEAVKTLVSKAFETQEDLDLLRELEDEKVLEETVRDMFDHRCGGF